MATQGIVTQEQVLFVRLPARTIHVGDMLRTPWGLRELHRVTLAEGDVWMRFRDDKGYVCGADDRVEVLVQ